MSEPQGGSGYLDTIFGGVRAFARELLASQQWLGRAEKVKDTGWRFTFLREAQQRCAAAARHLAEAEGQLGGAAPSTRATDAQTPFEQLQANIVAMREKLAAQEKRLRAAEGELAQGKGSRGSA